MGFIGLLTAALGLSADAFTVAVCKGMGLRRFSARYALTVAAFFGGFQGLMPLAGWLLGNTLRLYIARFDHWIAFFLLCAVGTKMVFDGLFSEEEISLGSRLSYTELAALGAATSIDALAVGVTLAFLQVNILTAAALIGSVTFLVSFLGVTAGCRLGARFDSRISVMGGIVLILLGVKLLFSG